jgi:hypothetical protein
VNARREAPTPLDAASLQRAVLDAGLEIYRVDPHELRVAQRVRMHLMDSGVAIGLDPCVSVRIIVRGQLSDFPGMPSGELFARVREALMPRAEARGYREVHVEARHNYNPADDSEVLDVWHELTFEKAVLDIAATIAEVLWALSLPKCIDP